MDQLDEGLAISIEGPVHEQALKAFNEQIQAWGIALPPVPPLVLDFGLGTFDKVGLIEFWIANELEAGYCGKYLYVSDGKSCPLHRHLHKHETFFVVAGSVRMRMNDQDLTLSQGNVLPVPPGVWHGFQGDGPALLLELSMPCVIADNVFADPGTGYGQEMI